MGVDAPNPNWLKSTGAGRTAASGWLRMPTCFGSSRSLDTFCQIVMSQRLGQQGQNVCVPEVSDFGTPRPLASGRSDPVEAFFHRRQVGIDRRCVAHDEPRDESENRVVDLTLLGDSELGA